VLQERPSGHGTDLRDRADDVLLLFGERLAALFAVDGDGSVVGFLLAARDDLEQVRGVVGVLRPQHAGAEIDRERGQCAAYRVRVDVPGLVEAVALDDHDRRA